MDDGWAATPAPDAAPAAAAAPAANEDRPAVVFHHHHNHLGAAAGADASGSGGAGGGGDRSAPAVAAASSMIASTIFNADERWDVLMFSIISAVGLVVGYLEASGIFNAPYSKFRRERIATWGYVPTRWGMLVAEMSALSVVLFFYLCYAVQEPYHSITFIIYTVIYTKRILEILFLHRYSGPVTVSCVVYLWATNVTLTAAACSSILFTHQNDDSNWNVLVLPIPLIAFGLIGNHYHHILLAQLRRTGKVNPHRPYRIPRGGLFYQTSCPHYLMEVFVWLGFSIVVHRPTMYGIFVFTLCKLAGRAFQSRRWYLANVRGYPNDRKCLVPFLF
ncbi:3-oxo-5-alpha-steroid 4-dehydrogenase-domain-containing protein [Zopfochytrium polystomum]|nr:3-oxo-5-alpha-steroid 4-dehydrogenase-domain-containing protein [Zopfochytrium polystomum]